MWLQNIVNLMTLVELGAFIVSAYQFWARRQERKIAVTSSCQRTAHLAPGAPAQSISSTDPSLRPRFS